MGFILIRHEVGEAVVDESAVPVYTELGWEVVNPKDDPAASPAEVSGAPDPGAPGQPGPPAGNASTDDWRAYAISHGVSAEEATQMGRDQIKALFVSEEN